MINLDIFLEQIETKDVADGNGAGVGTFTGIASTNTQDLAGDVIEAGAFGTVNAAQIPMLFAHRSDLVIGGWKSIDQNGDSLLVEGELNFDVEKGRKPNKTAIATLRKVLHMPHPSDLDQLSEVERKALSSFQLGTNGFPLSPEMSGQVLSCLEDKSDITGLMSNLAISGPSVRFLIDNVEIDEAAWACETSCFANNPKAKLAEGLGELELKPETLRYIVCTTSDLLEDASINIEAWMLNKVNSAFRRAVSSAIITGDGIGKPVGILKPGAGIIVCDTSDATPTNEITWQDLILLKWQVPVQYHAGARYLMNAQTFAKVLTISDAIGRPIMVASPLEPGQFLVNGSPVQIVTQMPEVAPGATPVAFGNWQATYMIVNRKAVTMQQDPYSAGFCVLYKFESRVGGGIICPQAARLLRVG